MIHKEDFLQENTMVKMVHSLFPSQSNETFTDILLFAVVIFSWLVWRSCDGTYTSCNLAKAFLILHVSPLTLFVQKMSFFVLFGGECIIVKKVISEQYTSAVLNIYVFL